MYTVAVVGAGGMGKTHLGNLRDMPNVRVDAICDPNPAIKGLAEELGARYFAELEEMLSLTSAQVVMVFTPTFLHAQQIEAVLKSGRHCITEKPICLSAQQARELFALAREMNVRLFVAQVLHFNDCYRVLAEIVRSERYGRVLDAYFCRLTQRPGWTSSSWLFDETRSGGIPYDLHIHELDFIVSLFGKPENARFQQSGLQEHYRFLYKCGGTNVCAEASWYNAPVPFTQGFHVYFERALVTLQDGCVTLYSADASDGTLLYQEPKETEGTHINVASALPYRRELEHFLQCIAQNRNSEIVLERNVIAVLETLEEMHLRA